MNNQKTNVEIALPGEKLSSETKDLGVIRMYGQALYDNNISFIKEKVPGNWFVAIDPFKGMLYAADSQISLYELTNQKAPNAVIFYIGLLSRNNINFNAVVV